VVGVNDRKGECVGFGTAGRRWREPARWQQEVKEKKTTCAMELVFVGTCGRRRLQRRRRLGRPENSEADEMVKELVIAGERLFLGTSRRQGEGGDRERRW
jgi:hypothetical protein